MQLPYRITPYQITRVELILKACNKCKGDVAYDRADEVFHCLSCGKRYGPSDFGLLVREVLPDLGM